MAPVSPIAAQSRAQSQQYFRRGGTGRLLVTTRCAIQTNERGHMPIPTGIAVWGFAHEALIVNAHLTVTSSETVVVARLGRPSRAPSRPQIQAAEPRGAA